MSPLVITDPCLWLVSFRQDAANPLHRKKALPKCTPEGWDLRRALLHQRPRDAQPLHLCLTSSELCCWFRAFTAWVALQATEQVNVSLFLSNFAKSNVIAIFWKYLQNTLTSTNYLASPEIPALFSNFCVTIIFSFFQQMTWSRCDPAKFY